MNIDKIKTIVNSGIDHDTMRRFIIEVIADDENVIPMVMQILDAERSARKELITDLNLNLSRAHIYIEERPESKKESKNCFNKTFVIDKIAEVYIKYKGAIQHCFNRYN